MKIKQISMAALIVLVIVLSIVMDFISMQYETSIFTDLTYWANTLTVQISVIVVLFAQRTIHKEKEMEKNERYIQLRQALEKSHANLNNRNMTGDFHQYIKADNRQRKLKVYLGKLTRKLNKVKEHIKRIENKVRARALKQNIRDENEIQKRVTVWQRNALHKLENKKLLIMERMDNAERDIEYLKVRYISVSYSVIFGDCEERNKDGQADMRIREGRDIVKILIARALMIFAFGVMATSFFVFDVQGFSLMVIYKGIIKLIQMVMGIYSGALAGTSFVRGKLCTKLMERANYVQQFCEGRK